MTLQLFAALFSAALAGHSSGLATAAYHEGRGWRFILFGVWVTVIQLLFMSYNLWYFLTYQH